MVSSGTAIKREFGPTLACAAAAVACAYGAFWLFQAGWMWTAIIPAALALVAGNIALASHSAPCPHCGAGLALGELGDGGAGTCGSCKKPFRIYVDRVLPLEPGHGPLGGTVHVDQMASRLTSIVFPPQCSVCGERAVRTETIGATYSTGGGWAQQYSFPVPHCSEHSRGAAFTKGGMVLWFRSHDYWREFCAANGIDETRASHET